MHKTSAKWMPCKEIFLRKVHPNELKLMGQGGLKGLVTLNITGKIPGRVKYQEEILCRMHSFYPKSQQKWLPAEIYSPLQEKCSGMVANHKQSEPQKTKLHHQHNASVSKQWINLSVTQKNGIT